MFGQQYKGRCDEGWAHEHRHQKTTPALPVSGCKIGRQGLNYEKYQIADICWNVYNHAGKRLMAKYHSLTLKGNSFRSWFASLLIGFL